MCVQAVGLIQAELERRDIVTASLTFYPDITRKIRPPRALSVPYPLGYPLGEPNNRALQLDILRRMLELCVSEEVPVLAEYRPQNS